MFSLGVLLPITRGSDAALLFGALILMSTVLGYALFMAVCFCNRLTKDAKGDAKGKLP